MNQTPPVPRARRSADLDELRLLTIFHFVYAGLSLLGLGFLAVQFAVMRAFFTDPPQWQGPVPEFPSWIRSVFDGFLIGLAVWTVVAGVLNLASGLCLRAGKRRSFSLVVAAVNCIRMPLGTALGVFSFIVLTRDSVKALYAERECGVE